MEVRVSEMTDRNMSFSISWGLKVWHSLISSHQQRFLYLTTLKKKLLIINDIFYQPMILCAVFANRVRFNKFIVANAYLKFPGPRRLLGEVQLNSCYERP